MYAYTYEASRALGMELASVQQLQEIDKLHTTLVAEVNILNQNGSYAKSTSLRGAVGPEGDSGMASRHLCIRPWPEIWEQN